MKKDLITHLFFTVAFLVLVSLIRGWFSLSYIPFWIGGLVGMLLPDIDYLINIYFLHPESSNSKDLAETIKNSSFVKSWDAIVRARFEHEDLIFHTVYFQIIFIIFTFLMMSSSGSAFGKGVVLAFSLHLVVDQVSDLIERGGIRNWFVKLNADFSSKGEKLYLVAQVALLCLFGFTF